MSLLGRALAARPRAAMTSHELQRILGLGWETEAGTPISTDTALQLGTVFACVRVLAESLGQVPLHVYRRAENGRERSAGHPTERLLDRPNPWQSAFEFREMLMAHVVLSGNAFALYAPPNARTGARGELLPLPPAWVSIVPSESRFGRHAWKVRFPDGGTLDVPPDRMLHIPGLSWNGRLGLSVLQYQRQILGIATQEQRYAAKLYANGGLIRGVIKHPKAFRTKESMERFRDQFDETYGSASNAFKVMVLEEGAEWQQTAMTAHDAEFLAHRKFTRSEIAGWYRVPLHMIGDLERSTNNNIEHQSLEFVKFTMLPWYTRIEQRLAMQLLPAAERGTHYLKFVVQGLERGDIATRTEAYTKGLDGGWLTPNDVRELEDMNTDPRLDYFRVPLNMRILGEAAPTEASPSAAPTPAEPSAPSTPPPAGPGNRVAAHLNGGAH